MIRGVIIIPDREHNEETKYGISMKYDGTMRGRKCLDFSWRQLKNERDQQSERATRWWKTASLRHAANRGVRQKPGLGEIKVKG